MMLVELIVVMGWVGQGWELAGWSVLGGACLAVGGAVGKVAELEVVTDAETRSGGSGRRSARLRIG